MKIHHVGIACHDIKKTLAKLKAEFTCTSVSDIVYDPLQDASVCLIRIEDGDDVELVSGKAVSSFIKNGPQVYHICYEVHDLQEAIATCIKNGAVLVSKPKAARLFGEGQIAFIQTEAGLIKFLENRSMLSTEGSEYTLTVTSSFTSDPMKSPLNFLAKKIGILVNIQFAPYNQIHQQLIDPTSVLNANQYGTNIILLKIEDWVRYKEKQHEEEVAKVLIEAIQQFASGLSAMLEKTNTTIIVAICEYLPKKISSKHYKEINEELRVNLSLLQNKYKQMSVLDLNESMQMYHDKDADELGHIPYSMNGFSNLSLTLMRKLYSCLKRPTKVIAVDADNVLWSGICGEQSVSDLEINARELLIQEMLLEQYEKGVLLCLVSKNNLEDVRVVFKHKKEMLLKEKHFVIKKVSWGKKSDAIKEISDELSLGRDAIVFLDDNPVECAEVALNVPEVATLNLPLDFEEIKARLESFWPLDGEKKTKEDIHRNQYYIDNLHRQRLQETVPTFQAFVEALDIKLDVSAPTEDELERASQLSHRVNQFNISANKFSAREILDIQKKNNQHILVARVTDKFGDYGLVGLVIGSITKDACFDVSDFMLSCRVLGKGVEHKIVQRLANYAAKHQCKHIRFLFKRTKKNMPAELFLKSILRSDNVKGLKQIKLGTSDAANITIESVAKPKRHAVAMLDAEVTKNSNVFKAAGLTEIAENLRTAEMVTKAIENKSELEIVEDKQWTVDGVEDFLIQLWREELSVAEINANSDFYNVCGESIVAIQLMIKMFKHFDVNFPLSDFLKHSCIKDMAAFIFSLINKSDQVYLPSIKKQDRNKPIDLSYAQRRLWFLEQMNSDSSAYNTFIALHLHGVIDVERLERSFATIIKRHEIFRTTYIKEYDEPKQIIHPFESIKFHVLKENISGLDKDKIFELVHKEAQRPFELNNPPLIRVSLLKQSHDEHVLMINMHHITNDAWSYNLFVKELNATYNNVTSLESVFLPELSFGYADYAVWQKNWVEQCCNLDQQVDYWRHKLKGSFATNFPIDFNSGKSHKKVGEKVIFELPNEIVKKLSEFSQKHHATLFMTLSSVFSLLIARYSNQDDIVFGTVASGRNQPELENIIGFFVNILMLRINLGDNPDFISLLNEGKKTVLEAFDHQYVPLEKLIEEMRPDRVGSGLPFANVMFVFEPDAIEPFNFDGVKVERAFADNDAFLLSDYDSAKFDFTMYIQSDGSKLNGVVEYDANLFQRESIDNIIDRFQVLVENVLKQPNTPVLTLPMLSDEELAELQKEAEAYKEDLFTDKNIIQLFDQQAKQHQDKVALRYSDAYMSYAELDLLSKQFASYLLSKGEMESEYVGVYLEDKKDFIIASLAVLRIGAIVVPLSTDYPKNRTLAIIESLSIKYVASVSTLNIFKNRDVNIVDVDVFHDELESIKPLESLSSADDAYVLFTSGSTGTPKGIKLCSSGIINVACNSGVVKLYPEDVIAQVASLSFDASLFEIWGALLNGAELVLFEKEDVVSEHRFIHQIENKHIGTMFLTTALFNQVVKVDPCAFKHMKYLIVGGESDTPKLMQKVAEKNRKPDCFLHAYGPTECTIFSTFCNVNSIEGDVRSVPIGSAINNISTFILDHELHLVPPGIPGELYIGGVGVSEGYVNHSELNDEKFIHHPMYKKGKLYKTGDIVRQLPNGDLQFIGRVDDLIKIRGFRVELHEIEEELVKHPLVKEAAVLIKSNKVRGKYLAAYVVPKANVELDSNMLRLHLRQSLHVNLVPPEFYQLNQLPMNKNGKIDKKALLSIYHRPLSSNIIVPTTACERTVANIFADILGINHDQVGLQDSFFDLGGHSLLVIKVITEIQIEMGVELKISDFFMVSTVMGVSQLISNYQNKDVSGDNKASWVKQHLTASSLIALKTQGTKRPLFLMHPVGGTVFCYLPLVKHLGSDQPCYAIQDPSIESGKIMYATIEEMAAQYISFMKQVQPHGPYMVCGHSFGGMVAAEIAHQLLQNGEKVAFLGVLDTWLLSKTNDVARNDLKGKMIYQYEMTKLKLAHEEFSQKDPLIELNYHRLQKLGFGHTPKVVDCKLHLFKAMKNMDGFDAIEDEFNHWQPYCTLPVEAHLVNGDHESMLQEPCVGGLAEQVASCISHAEIDGFVEEEALLEA